MELICYMHPSWPRQIRPADATRQWMTETSQSYAYRCLPLNIANAHGWEIISPCSFEAVWNGGPLPGDVRVSAAPDIPQELLPKGQFGYGVLTFHIFGLFRTPPGWNMWVGGSPNRFKHGISPLTGVIETDWAPYTFTMNWRFTAPDLPVKFEEGEPIGFIFPIGRGILDSVEPRYENLEQHVEVSEQLATWAIRRGEFERNLAANPSEAPTHRWQKDYYRGLLPDGSPGTDDHQGKLRVKPFK